MKKEQPRKDNLQHIRNRAEKIMRHEHKDEKRRERAKLNKGGNRQISKRKEIFLPKNFNLTENYDETMHSIDEVRRINALVGTNQHYYINFDNIEKIGPGAALVLASEFHVSNLRSMYQAKWRYVDDNKWDDEVRSLLIDMGFHKILKLSSKVSDKRRKNTDLRFLEFCSKAIKNNPKMDMGKFLYEEISQKIKDEFAGSSFSSKLLRKLGAGISEAVLNTGHHAYASKDKASIISRWWISASIQKSTKEIKVICYDRGLSIPETVPKFFKDFVDFEKIKGLVLARDDANLIKVAVTTDRSQIKKSGRGNGLPQLQEFIDESKRGKLVVLSRFGRAVYSKLSDKETKWKVEKLPRPMLGTLIVWSIIQE